MGKSIPRAAEDWGNRAVFAIDSGRSFRAQRQGCGPIPGPPLRCTPCCCFVAHSALTLSQTILILAPFLTDHFFACGAFPLS
jgi:hypothetical protein